MIEGIYKNLGLSNKTEFDLAMVTWDKRASNWSESFQRNWGQFSAPGIKSFKLDNIWQPLQTPKVKVSV